MLSPGSDLEKTIIQWQKNIESLRLGTDRVKPKDRGEFTRMLDLLTAKLDALRDYRRGNTKSHEPEAEKEVMLKKITHEMEDAFTSATSKIR